MLLRREPRSAARARMPSERVAKARDLLEKNPDWTYRQVAEELGSSQASVSRLMRAFHLLPEAVWMSIENGVILESYAYYLSQIAHLPEELDRMVAMIRSGKITKRKALIKHIDVILNRTPLRMGLTHEFEAFKVICKETDDPTIASRVIDAVAWAVAQMKAGGWHSLEEFWQLASERFTANAGRV
jgi:hypothetical protein